MEQQPPPLAQLESSLERVETQLSTDMLRMKKQLVAFRRARKAIRGKPSKAISDLRRDLAKAGGEGWSDTLIQLEANLREFKQEAIRTFPAELAKQAEIARIRFVARSPGESTLGPLVVRHPVEAESAEISFARVVIAKGTPLDAAVVVALALKAQAEILAPVDVPKAAEALREGMRVAVARGRESAAAGPLRAELPAVFEEVRWVKERSDRGAGPYGLARFVVELKTLIQSDHNVRASPRFHLEPAVLENARNPKRSVFVPDNLDQADGEGSWYQAITLR